MKKLYNEHKLMIGILFRFLLVYIILIIVYDKYLGYYQQILRICDPYTEYVAKASARMVSLFKSGYSIRIAENVDYASVRYYGKQIYRVVEGCNAISIIILFISFIIGFFTKWKEVILAIILGTGIIYLVNNMRIAFMYYVSIFMKDYAEVVHTYIFPAIIYVVVVVLWIVWIKFFALKKLK